MYHPYLYSAFYPHSLYVHEHTVLYLITISPSTPPAFTLYSIYYTSSLPYLLPILPADCCIYIAPAAYCIHFIYCFVLFLYIFRINDHLLIVPIHDLPCLHLPCVVYFAHYLLLYMLFAYWYIYTIPAPFYYIHFLTYWPIDCSAPYPIIPFSYLPIFSPDLLLLCTKCYRLPTDYPFITPPSGLRCIITRPPTGRTALSDTVDPARLLTRPTRYPFIHRHQSHSHLVSHPVFTAFFTHFFTVSFAPFFEVHHLPAL